MIWVFIFCLWPPDKAGRKSGCGAGRPAFLQEMKTSASNSRPSHDNQQIILLNFINVFLLWLVLLTSWRGPSFQKNWTVFHNWSRFSRLRCRCSEQRHLFSFMKSLTIFFLLILHCVLRAVGPWCWCDIKAIMTWCINDHVNSYLWGHSHWLVSVAQWVPRGQVLSTAACWTWNSFFLNFHHWNQVYLQDDIQDNYACKGKPGCHQSIEGTADMRLDVGRSFVRVNTNLARAVQIKWWS